MKTVGGILIDSPQQVLPGWNFIFWLGRAFWSCQEVKIFSQPLLLRVSKVTEAKPGCHLAAISTATHLAEQLMTQQWHFSVPSMTTGDIQPGQTCNLRPGFQSTEHGGNTPRQHLCPHLYTMTHRYIHTCIQTRQTQTDIHR